MNKVTCGDHPQEEGSPAPDLYVCVFGLKGDVGEFQESNHL